TVTGKFNALEKNPELAHIFEDLRRAMGGVPEEVKTVLQDIQNKPITLQEACLKGDLKTLEDYLQAAGEARGPKNIDEKDAKGISCLGYAIGANRTHVVKKLLESKANPWEVDNSGGNSIHYASAYGRKELCDYFIKAKGDVNKQNTQGQTPLALAQKNKMKAADGPILSHGPCSESTWQLNFHCVA
ncbi:unnamed protein product, partial [Effrenium voratum]